MNVTEEAGKTLMLGELSTPEWKLFCTRFCIKSSTKSTFVQSSNRQNLN